MQGVCLDKQSLKYQIQHGKVKEKQKNTISNVTAEYKKNTPMKIIQVRAGKQERRCVQQSKLFLIYDITANLSLFTPRCTLYPTNYLELKLFFFTVIAMICSFN